MNKNLVILIIASLVIFVVGGGVGVFYQMQKDAVKVQSIDNLSTKAVPSIVAYGEVTKIDGEKITLNYGGDNLTVRVKDDVTVYSFVTDSAGKSIQQKVDLSQIKMGDNLNISIKILPGGELQGESIIVLPTFSSEATPVGTGSGN